MSPDDGAGGGVGDSIKVWSEAANMAVSLTHEVSRKTIARGTPGDPGVTVVTTLVCFFHLHARLRAHPAPGIPCAL